AFALHAGVCGTVLGLRVRAGTAQPDIVSLVNLAEPGDVIERMSLIQDLKFAVRLMVKERWFTAVALIALALGIGVDATRFTFVNAVLIRGLPFDDPDRIMSIAERDMARGRDLGISYPNFRDWREAQASFVDIAAYNATTMNVSDEGRAPERYTGPYISANAFR